MPSAWFVEARRREIDRLAMPARPARRQLGAAVLDGVLSGITGKRH